MPGLPAGVKFDPSDQEILQHLEAKLLSRSHPLIDEFIPTIQGQNGICYTHPEKLPGIFICNSQKYTSIIFLSSFLYLQLIFIVYIYMFPKKKPTYIHN